MGAGGNRFPARLRRNGGFMRKCAHGHEHFTCGQCIDVANHGGSGRTNIGLVRMGKALNIPFQVPVWVKKRIVTQRSRLAEKARLQGYA